MEGWRRGEKRWKELLFYVWRWYSPEGAREMFLSASVLVLLLCFSSYLLFCRFNINFASYIPSLSTVAIEHTFPLTALPSSNRQLYLMLILPPSRLPLTPYIIKTATYKLPAEAQGQTRIASPHTQKTHRQRVCHLCSSARHNTRGTGRPSQVQTLLMESH